MSVVAPRLVVAYRPSELTELTMQHGVRGQAEFFLKERGRSLAEVDEAHARQESALAEVRAAAPAGWRRADAMRDEFHRFAFAPEDVIAVVGPDGLVANVAKYLTGQPVVGINPDPEHIPGVLLRHRLGPGLGDVLAASAAGTAVVEPWTMARMTLDDGRRLDALNEIFIGHPSHQSARYRLAVPGGASEQQSSSGIIASTGTGSTGWAASLNRIESLPLPLPADESLAWFVREAWPSAVTGTSLTRGLLAAEQQLEITVASDTLMIFGDGIESDRITARYGQRIVVGASPQRLNVAAAITPR